MIKRISKLANKVFSVDKTKKAYNEGMDNFEYPNPKIEMLAKERMEKVASCKHFKDEPIKQLRVNDVLIPEASGKYCDNCGCIISYKIRQSIEKCPCWNED